MLELKGLYKYFRGILLSKMSRSVWRPGRSLDFRATQFAIMALLCSVTQLVHAQNAPVSAADVEQRIQHVIAGLNGGAVVKGDEHATQTLADRMKELRVPA